MTKKKLKKIAADIRSLQNRSSIRSRELEDIAKRLERRRVGTGGHGQWISDLRTGRITISTHPKPLKDATAAAILAELDADVFHWKLKLRAQELDDSGNE